MQLLGIFLHNMQYKVIFMQDLIKFNPKDKIEHYKPLTTLMVI